MKGVFWNSQYFKNVFLPAQESQLIKMILPYLSETLPFFFFFFNI